MWFPLKPRDWVGDSEIEFLLLKELQGDDPFTHKSRHSEKLIVLHIDIAPLNPRVTPVSGTIQSSRHNLLSDWQYSVFPDKQRSFYHLKCWTKLNVMRNGD
jgi:hypothetical protein